ncbi:hypothetical protein [Mixta hanseatica]|uniref:Conjugal transfer entry exclusion protein TraS n=1 Tax=Mixta hanseatica TaxID=2872648 RepID=A0ABY4RFB5_9GAMM|nr:hypothetical protein [Mixta hanseatica]MDU3818618.1 hypothetical protein [Pantoea sp.]MDU5189499.1 hypothetical protein [Mixta calida]UQY46253.1 hypothetical protein K6958_20620 [Mixta hanseatica]
MSITYNQIKLEVRQISEELARSNSVVPGVFQSIKGGLLPALIYFCFYIACIYTDVYIKTVWQGVGVISIFFWVFITLFMSGYGRIFSMLPKDAGQRYEIVRIYTKKVKVYYLVWVAAIVVAGLVSVFSILNIIALAGISLLSTVIIALAFNFDISRFQLAGLFGVLSAAKDNLNR